MARQQQQQPQKGQVQPPLTALQPGEPENWQHAVHAHLLRNVVVTELYDRGASAAVKSSCATAMGQSPVTQAEVYDRRNQTQEIAPALADVDAQVEQWAQNGGCEGVAKDPALPMAPKRKQPCSTPHNVAKAGGKKPKLAANPPGHDAGSFAVDKVLEARANGQGTLIKAKVAWKPTWEPAKNLTEVTIKEACPLLFG